MKKLTIFFAAVLLGLMFFGSCKVNTYYAEARYGNIVLDTLSRSDVQIIGQCTAEAMITKTGKALDKQYAKQYKQGGYTDFISVAANPTVAKAGFFKKLAGLKGSLIQDPGRDFVMYALFEKYPDVDYFTDVRIDRIITVQGKTTTEKLTVRAIGIKIIPDQQ